MGEETTQVNDRLANDDGAPDTFLDCALEVAQGIDSLEGRSEIISIIAFRYADAGQIDHAVDIAETINDSYLRDQTLAGIAAKCIEVGVADYADTVADTIEDDTAFALATEQMAVAYAEQGVFEKSIEVAHQLEESAPTLNRIALSLLARGQHVEALEAARSIDYPDLKAPLLVELASSALRDGRNTDALELLLEATRTAEEIEFADQRISTLISIASVTNRCDQEDHALEILSRAHDQCKKSRDFAPDAVLAEIAGAYAEMKRYETADKVIEEIENPFQFAHATARVSIEYTRAGNTARALELLADATEIVREEEVYGHQSLLMRESVLSELGSCYALVGHYDEALQMIGMMSSQDRQDRSLDEIAKQAVRSGNHNRASQAAEMIKDNYARVLCDLSIVDALIESNQLEMADHALSQLFARAAEMERPYERAMALMEIAPRFAQRELAAQASRALSESLTTLAIIEDGYHRSHALINLSGKYQKLEQQPGEREQTVLEEILHRLER
jgi:tetratricopeptide (TPR) repeat protein